MNLALSTITVVNPFPPPIPPIPIPNAFLSLDVSVCTLPDDSYLDPGHCHCHTASVAVPSFRIASPVMHGIVLKSLVGCGDEKQTVVMLCYIAVSQGAILHEFRKTSPRKQWLFFRTNSRNNARQ